MGIRLARDMLNLYGRSFKKEPFFVLEITQGLLSGLLLPWAAMQGGAQGLLWAWLGINLALSGPNWRTFLHFRTKHTRPN
jgi:membrane associated rhomboid family serine protease